jgi:hypothetical protein
MRLKVQELAMTCFSLPRAMLYFALLIAIVSPVGPVSAHTESDMEGAASRFLAALSIEQQHRAAFSFKSDERLKWHFIPNELYPRHGISLKELNADQRALARALLHSGLSERGYLTATAIMDLERLLRALENDNRFARDPEDYYISLFGTPDPGEAWGWRIEGHHLSLHFTVVDGQTTVSSPSFFGASPAEVHGGSSKGRRLLAPQEDAARLLVLALNPAQRAQALVSGVAPRDIVTGNKVAIDPLSPVGIEASALSSDQQGLLQALLETYTSLMADDIAAERWSRIRKTGLDKVSFAWAGSTEHGKPHYYRVQGPTFLVEFDNTQNDANHIHSVWRDFTGDFGQDLLREHVESVKH